MKANKNPQSIRLDPEIKGWLYTRCQNENRSLSNLINTILMKEKESTDDVSHKAIALSNEELEALMKSTKENFINFKLKKAK